VYILPHILRVIKKDEMCRSCSMPMRDEMYAVFCLVGKPEGKNLLGRPRCR
jgi:hypothetical protein